MVKTMTIDDLLVKFKSLEKIDHNSEDEYLKQLKMSYERIKISAEFLN